MPCEPPPAEGEHDSGTERDQPMGFRNRSLVSAEWLFSYVMHQRHGRIILNALGD